VLRQQIGAQRRLAQKLRADPVQERRLPAEQHRRQRRAAEHHDTHDAHTQDDPVGGSGGHIGIGAQVAAPAIRDHPQAQRPEAQAHHPPDVARQCGGIAGGGQFRVRTGDLGVAVMREVEGGVELCIQQRRAGRDPLHDRIGSSGGEGGLVRRLVRRGEQRDLHQAQRGHRRQLGPARGDGDQPSGSGQAGDVDREPQAALPIRTALQGAEFGAAQDAVGQHGHAATPACGSSIGGACGKAGDG